MLPTILAAATLALFLLMVSPAINPQRWPLAVDLSRQGVVFALIGLAIMIFFFRHDPAVVPILVLVIVVHEYGHVLAFRLAGHRMPVFRLAPLGGVAFSERQTYSHQESAFIAMMGPGFSIVLALASLMAIKLLAQQFDPSSGSALSPETGAFTLSTIAIMDKMLWWCAFLNFVNLLPFYPLDGGRTLRAIASYVGPVFADRLLYGLTGLLILLGLLPPFNIFLILIGVFGLVAIRNEEKLNRNKPKITAGNALLVGGAYLSMLLFLGFLTLGTGPIGFLERMSAVAPN